jgi:hypothetical protein
LKKNVDIYSSKFAIIVIIMLVTILALQIMTNDNTNTLIDSETCELYIMDSQINAKQYQNEFDEKCLDFKSLNP